MTNLKQHKPGEIKYYFKFDYPLYGNSSWCDPIKVKFLSENNFVEVNFDNSRKSIYQDDYNPKSDRLGFVLDSNKEHLFFFDTYEESLKSYIGMHKSRTEEKLLSYEKKLESAKRDIINFEKEILDTKNEKYTTEIHGNPEHVPETTIVYDTTMEKIELIYNILIKSYKNSVTYINKEAKLGEKVLSTNFIFIKKEEKKDIADILNVSYEELKKHKFLILTSDNIPTISKSYKNLFRTSGVWY